MSDVMFNEEPSYARRRTPETSSQQGSITSLLLKLGVAKTQKDASLILSGIIIVCIIVSVVLIVMVQPHPKNAAQLQRDVERFQAMNHTPAPANQ